MPRTRLYLDPGGSLSLLRTPEAIHAKLARLEREYMEQGGRGDFREAEHTARQIASILQRHGDVRAKEWRRCARVCREIVTMEADGA